MWRESELAGECHIQGNSEIISADGPLESEARQGIIKTAIIFGGTLNSWRTKIIIGALFFIFIILQTWIARSALFHRSS
ncbi:MAG: hypothetical protein LBK91_06790 [Synergistaceae bacterium]|nr:hypothetical protein [Synergistaceae bacterium]